MYVFTQVFKLFSLTVNKFNMADVYCILAAAIARINILTSKAGN